MSFACLSDKLLTCARAVLISSNCLVSVTTLARLAHIQWTTYFFAQTALRTTYVIQVSLSSRKCLCKHPQIRKMATRFECACVKEKRGAKVLGDIKKGDSVSACQDCTAVKVEREWAGRAEMVPTIDVSRAVERTLTNFTYLHTPLSPFHRCCRGLSNSTSGLPLSLSQLKQAQLCIGS